MEVLSYVLKALLAAVFLVVAYAATMISFPCLSYPTAYSKTKEFGRKVEAFHTRHGHLPHDSFPSHVAELDLSPGYSFSYWSDRNQYVLRVEPGVDSDDKGSALLPFKVGFDGPWVAYNASSKSVSCGHR